MYARMCAALHLPAHLTCQHVYTSVHLYLCTLHSVWLAALTRKVSAVNKAPQLDEQ